MIDARELFERRLLAILEQRAGIEMPADWRRLQPEPSHLRPAAAAVLRVAETQTRDEMKALLRRWSDRIGYNREGREGGEDKLWQGLAEALEHLAERPEDGPAGLLGLSLWSAGAKVPLDELWPVFRPSLPGTLAVREPFLDEVARVLLRALARKWMAAAGEEAGE